MGKGLVYGMLVGFLTSGSALAVASLMAPQVKDLRSETAEAERTAEPEVAETPVVEPETAEAEAVEAEVATEAAPSDTTEAEVADAVEAVADAEPEEPAAEPEAITEAAPESPGEATPPAEIPLVEKLPEPEVPGVADEVPAVAEVEAGSEPAPESPTAPEVYAAAPETEPDLPETKPAEIPQSAAEAPQSLAATEPPADETLPETVEPAPAPSPAEPVPALTAENAGAETVIAGAPEIGEPDLAAPAEAPAKVEEPAAADDAMESAAPEPAEEETGAPVILTVESQPLVNPDAPQPGFSEAAGVKINRLPSIGASAEAEAEAEVAPDAAAETGTGIVIPAKDDMPAVERYAVAFDNPDAKPIVGTILIDLGEEAGGLDAAALAAIGLPVTIAIDPLRPDAAARAAAYRAAGMDVAILAPELPAGAAASDLEVSYQAIARSLPETVALIGRPGAAFQSDRRMAQHLVALLGGDGRGLVTYDRGLNPAQQAAFRGGLAHASVYRELDAGGESAPAIGRYLDRAAFEATRQGEVLVVGTSAPATVQALKDWAAAGAKGSVIAPVSAVMQARR